MENINLIVIVVYVIVAIVLTVWWLILKGRDDTLKTRERIVGQRECNCDRRCEILDDAENAFDTRFNETAKWIDDSVDMNASYVVTESDELRFTTEQAIKTSAKRQLAHVIANDMMRRFELKEEKTEFGRTKFSYHFRVLEDKR